MFYRKVRHGQVLLYGVNYVYPRHHLIVRSGYTAEEVCDFYEELTTRDRVGVIRTPDINLVRIFDEQLYKSVGNQSPLYYWYEESYYLTTIVKII